MTSIQSLNERLNKLYLTRRFHFFACSLIAAAILMAYSNTFTASFHLDDMPSIVENPAIKRVTLNNIKSVLNTTRPVLNLTLMLNYQISGLNVIGWHVVNTAFHIANSILVYLLILWTLNLPSFSSKYVHKAARMALFGSLLFALHPVQTEAVTYIISRSELLAAFFYLITFLLFLRSNQTGNFRYSIGAFFTSLLAMGSKEWAVTLPAMIFLYDYLFIAGGKIQPIFRRWKAYLLLLLPWGLIAYILTFYKGASSAGFGVTASNSNITPWTYLFTSFNVLWTYIRMLFLPINQNLDYDYPIAKTLLEFPAALSFIGHAAVAGAAFWFYKNKGWLMIPFGIAWFYITLSPTQSFVPIRDVIFEHRVYLPSLGFFIVFVAAYEGMLNWWENRRAAKKGLSAIH